MNQSRATRDKKDSLRSRSIDWLFPAESRQFYGQRWLNILLRSVHLLGVAGVGGGIRGGRFPLDGFLDFNANHRCSLVVALCLVECTVAVSAQRCCYYYQTSVFDNGDCVASLAR